MATNAATPGVVFVTIWLVGPEPFLAVQIPIALLGARIGVWLFYVQRQFQGAIWERTGDWDIRYPLSLSQVEDILFERGIDICHETVRLTEHQNTGHCNHRRMAEASEGYS